MSKPPNEFVGNAEAAAYLEIPVKTWSSYVARDQAPKPDRREVVSSGHALPVWFRSTLDTWQAGRPGRGRRRA